ncbi:uncharacterized protein A4U43_C06F5340 [Asparagus officinalis]|uniref:Uncharacterized protein n=1 Tax=Asparagus officinalis TaxID=4686 RepID=A0A5P1ELZ7_ASPOF|nr:uncharacterized protein A4U43_C06F5340 [Asparagus officinalis]
MFDEEVSGIRCGRFPPEVRTAIPVEGRFEHIVLSCNTTSDHGIIWIEKEAQKALDRMKETSVATSPPAQQRMERKQTLEKEHIDALERAVSLHVPHAVAPSDEATAEALLESSEETTNPPEETSEASSRGDSKFGGRTNWLDLVEKLFSRNESGNLVLKKDISVP